MKKITRYSFQIHGGQDGSGSGKNVRAQIQLFGDRNAMSGWIDFFADGTILPNDRKDEQHIVMALPLSILQSVIALLDSSDEVYLKWQEEPQNAVLTTGNCEVGRMV